MSWSTGMPATATSSPACRASRWKVSAVPPFMNAAAHTATPPASTSWPSATTPWAPQPISAPSPRRSATAARPSSAWSRLSLPAKTMIRSAGAPPSRRAARAAASANASTPPSLRARPDPMRVVMRRSVSAQLELLARRLGRRRVVLPHQDAEALRGARGVGAAVVVEQGVHLLGLLGHRRCALADLAELVLAVVPVEPLGHRLALQVALGVASVHAQVGELRVRHRVDRRHDRHVVAGRGVDRDPGDAAVLVPAERLLDPLVADPAAVAQLDGQRVRLQS